MKLKLTLLALTLSFCSALSSSSQEEAKDNFGTLLKSTGWDVLIGTWLNPAGEEFVFSWQHADTALKMEAEVGGIKRNSVYVKRPNSNVANAFAYDSNGGSSFGNCTFAKEGIQFVMKTYSETGELKEMKFTYTLTSETTFEVKMEGNDHVFKYTRK